MCVRGHMSCLTHTAYVMQMRASHPRLTACVLLIRRLCDARCMCDAVFEEAHSSILLRPLLGLLRMTADAVIRVLSDRITLERRE